MSQQIKQQEAVGENDDIRLFADSDLNSKQNETNLKIALLEVNLIHFCSKYNFC
jgi:hypothetical protein